MMHHAAFGVLVAVAVVGTIGNLLVIGAVFIYKRLRVRSHVFIVNLAVADLLVTSYIMPVGLATSQYVQSPFGKTMCDLNAFLIMTSMGVSTQTLMAIALERYFHICRTSLYRKLFTKRLMTLYVIAIWLYTIALTSQGFGPWTNYKYSYIMYICIFDGELSVSYNVVLAVVGMIMPILVVAVCYVLILRTVRRGSKALASHRIRGDPPSSNDHGNISTSRSMSTLSLDKEHKMQRREHQLAVTLFTIVIIFVLCWLPATFVLTFSNIWKTMPDILWPIAIWLAFCNSSVNSIVYGVMNKNFRAGYKELLEYLCCCCRFLTCPPCSCSSPYANANDDSFNSQIKLAGAFIDPEETPTYHNNFRFSASNELKGYGSGSTTPNFQELRRNGRAVQNGDIPRHRSPPQPPPRSSTPPQAQAQPPPPPPPPPLPPILPSARPKPSSQPSTPIPPLSVPATRTRTEELYDSEDDYASARQLEEPLHYSPMHAHLPEVEYVYGAFSCGNSSIITIGSGTSDDAEYRRLSSRVSSGICSSSDNVSVLILPNQTTYRSQAEGIYDEIGNVHLSPKKTKPVVKTTNVIGLRNGGKHAIYEVPIPEGKGEIILPTQVNRTPVQSRKYKHETPM